MIASARELGLGDDHDGILRLATLGIDAPVGTDAIALLGLDDVAVEINVTPDRGYAFSIRGVAREYAHATGARFRDPAEQSTRRIASGDAFPVEIRDDAPIRGRVGATVFATRIVRGVDPTRPTPAWMIARLTLAGIRSLSLLVDITNYVMLELGQPIHGYDLDTLQGGIVVRRARRARSSRPSTARCARSTPRTCSSPTTAAPSASPASWAAPRPRWATPRATCSSRPRTSTRSRSRRTARRHKLPSEASKRFERGVDPAIAGAAAARVAQLMVDLAGGTADDGGSLIHEAPEREAILLPDGFVRASSASSTPTTRCTTPSPRSAARRHAGRRRPRGRPALVAPRPHRQGRPRRGGRPARGYHRIPSVLPVAPPGRGLTRSQRVRRRVADARSRPGLDRGARVPVRDRGRERARSARRRRRREREARERARRVDAVPAPLAAARLIGVARRNLSRGLTDLDVFEIGLVFLPETGRTYGTAELPPAARPMRRPSRRLDAGIPPQPRHVGVLLTGDVVPKQPGSAPVTAGIADALDAVRRSRSPRVPRSRSRRARTRRCTPAAPPRCVAGPRGRGYAGELHPALTAEADLPRVVAVAELDLDAVIALTEPAVEARADRHAARRDAGPLARGRRRRAGRRRSPARCARARASCSSTCNSSTTTAARACPRARRASRSRCASAPPTARSPRPRRARPSSRAPRLAAERTGAATPRDSGIRDSRQRADRARRYRESWPSEDGADGRSVSEFLDGRAAGDGLEPRDRSSTA